MMELQITPQQKVANLARAIKNYDIFTFEIFSKSFDNFIGGDYIHGIAKEFEDNKYTFDVAARDHYKSTRLYAKFMYNLLKYAHCGREAHYFSFNESMARYHIQKIKEFIRANPYYDGLIDMKPTAEGVIEYKSARDRKAPSVTLEPHGLLSFKRGIHCDDIYIDDPLRDPENKLNPTVIEKVNRVIFTEILAMVKKEGEIHGVGTPQTWQDFFFDDRLKELFLVTISPAIKSEAEKIVLWPEWMSYEDLCRRRDVMTPKIFNQEMQCKPVYSENSYFEEQQIFDVINSTLTNWSVYSDLPELFESELKTFDIFGGWDLGKKAHPSHFCVFKYDTKQDKYTQIHQAFFDNWDYYRQLEYVDEAIKRFHINEIQFDATRGELEGFKEQGLLSEHYLPVIFSQKTKNAMATSLQKKINGTKIKEENGERTVIERKVELIDDSRQINQILAVDNDLDAVASPEGHGDAFWSIAMALKEKGFGRAFASKPEGF